MNKNNDVELDFIRKITGEQLIYLLKELGIFQKDYARKIIPPLNTAQAINKLRNQNKISYRYIKPLTDEYSIEFLINILKDKYEVS
jgi:hypothetical protein